MNKFTNPLDNIRVASPCSADWDEMYGNARKRFCGDCKLNVYNLSEMTRQDAENLLVTHEGRLCVRYYRRADGTVLTKNCPVGWRAVKQRVSRTVTAAASVVVGFATGIFALRTAESAVTLFPTGDVPAIELADPVEYTEDPMMGDIAEPTNFDTPENWTIGRERSKEIKEPTKFTIMGGI